MLQRGKTFASSLQKQMLEGYALHHGLPTPIQFTNDSASCTRFNRPDFLAMMEEVEAARVEAIVIKDMILYH